MIRYFQTPEGAEIPYDYENPKTVEVLGGTFVSSAATDKWIQCSKAAKSCCENMDEGTVHPGTVYWSSSRLQSLHCEYLDKAAEA